jgi:hypothetical protein
LLPVRAAQVNDKFDFDGGTERELGDADGRAGVYTLLAKKFAQKVRSAVHHLRLAVKASGGGNITSDLCDTVRVLQRSDLGLNSSEGVKDTEAGGLFCFFDGDVRADLACVQKPSSFKRELSGCEQ